MEHALAELPLALFTTLTPMGAGAFIVVALAANFTTFSNEQLKKVDHFTLIPLAVVIVGLIASVLHLSAPLNAIYLLDGLGRSPLTAEIVVAGIFVVLALVYCLLAFTGKLSYGARRVFLVIISLCSLVLSVFIGLAYMLETILSWYTFQTVLEIPGFCLMGGSLLGIMVLVLSKTFEEARASKPFKSTLIITVVLGTVLSVGALLSHVAFIHGLANSVATGTELLAEVVPFLIGFIALAILSCVIALLLIIKGPKKALSITGALLAMIAIFCARMVFYATQMSVGLN